MKHHSLLLLVLQVLLQITIRTPACAEDNLPRRPFVGVQLDAKDGQVKIGRIFPNSSASRSGLKVDDVVLAIDETKITTVSEFLAAMKRFRTGDHVKCAIVRDKKDSFVEVTLTEWPRETPDGFKVLYDQVPVGAKSLRCLVTRPPQAAEGKVPAAFYIQGIDCASIEHPFPGPNHMRDFVYELSRAGFAVMRSEKSSIGDSSSPDCKHLGLDEEVADFTAALKKLKSYDFVDSNKVFLFGHSAGGWVAPLVAVNEQVAGVAVYGTVVRPFGEYLVENHRRNKWHRNHPDPAELELEVRRMARLWHLLLEERRTSAETLKAEPALTDVAKHVFRGEPDCPYDVRSLGYFRDVHDRNMPAVWGKLRVPVLAMMGQYEVRTSEFEHQYIADIVNYYAPGKATWKVLPKLDHGFAVHDSMQDAVDNEFQGPFGNTVVAQSVEWMNAVVQGLDSEIKKQ